MQLDKFSIKKKKKKEILTRICLNEYNIKHFKPVKIR